MKSGRGIVEIFGRCSRLLNKIALNAGDEFFSQLCVKKSDRLMSDFVFFLRGEGGNAKPNNIVQHERRVAQCHLRLISQIEDILNLLDVLKHLGLAKSPTSLPLEKNLLLLKLSVLNACRPMAQPLTEAERPVPLKIRKTNLRHLPKLNQPKLNPPKLGQTHQEISEFIKGKEQTQNLEVFSRFSHIGRRTLKKKLSDLARANVIKRIANGKKVFYSVSAESQS